MCTCKNGAFVILQPLRSLPPPLYKFAVSALSVLSGPVVHGERLVGIQDSRGEGLGVPGVQGDAVLHGVRDSLEQLRGRPELQGRLGPSRRRVVSHQGRLG